MNITKNRKSRSYRLRNWSEYNAGMKQRGSLTFWMDEATIEGWQEPALSGRRGASRTYRDLAIATFETLKCVYGLARRQTEGLLGSLETCTKWPEKLMSTANRPVKKSNRKLALSLIDPLEDP